MSYSSAMTKEPQPLRIDMHGGIYASAEARNVGHLRELVKWCDEYNVRDDAALDWGVGVVHIDIVDNGPAEWTCDGDSIEQRWNVVVDVSPQV
jgi:hypothetical protein